MRFVLIFFLACVAFTVAAQTAPEPDYVGTPACIACHQDQGEAWSGSHHALAWTLPAPDTVVADFNDASFDFEGLMHRFRRDGDAYVIEEETKDGVIETHKIVGVAGIEPLQQYLVETEPGRVQSHDVVWDTEEERWYHLYPDSWLQADSGLHWSGPYKNWNSRCAECHATAFEKRYDPQTRRYSSRQEEIGVGCEACHGPGSAHVALIEDGAAPGAGLDAAGFTMTFDPARPRAEIEQCAGCHARRAPLSGKSPTPGTPFADAYRLTLLTPGLYHPDGAILDEVYVYGSFRQSKMYASGVRCGDCHEPHAAELRVDGDAVCTQCHSPEGAVRFASLTGAVYDDPAHHFHEPASEAARCVSCHMIERNYMIVDGRRDHSFRVPRPDLSDKTGAPNACTDCHADRGAEWAAAEIAARFPNSTRRGPHFSEVFAPARIDASAHVSALLEIARDPTIAGIVRATALELLTSVANEEIAAETEAFLSDEDPVVRAAAVPVQRGAPGHVRLQRLALSLSDPMRSVRIAAARELVTVRVARMPERLEEAMSAAFQDWRRSMSEFAEYPETHLALGGTALVLRNLPAGEAAFREAVTLDPQLSAAWRMIARIRETVGDIDGALAALDEGLSQNPAAFELINMRSRLTQ